MKISLEVQRHGHGKFHHAVEIELPDTSSDDEVLRQLSEEIDLALGKARANHNAVNALQAETGLDLPSLMNFYDAESVAELVKGMADQIAKITELLPKTHPILRTPRQG